MLNTQKVMPMHRNHKARIFEMNFRDKNNLLELYNAVNGTSYANPDDLQINTLENAIYLTMKNDISFIIDSRLELYEHQSTWCPNLPLRFLDYVRDVLADIIKNANLYGTKLIHIPTPRVVIFYNGGEEFPDVTELKLSDAFIIPEKEPALELKATMLNVNKGHNEQLMLACKTLKDYAEYTHRVRLYAKTMDVEAAVKKTIKECIEEGILKDFLLKNQAEAISMSIYEYDLEKHIRLEREDAWAEGYDEATKQAEARIRELEEKLARLEANQ